ncbi:MAG: dephospho-CoA kinase [Ginsengibacter sp.]
MLRIGLTGGIGSGKSTVAQIFKILGVPVYDADTASKLLMNESEEIKRKLIREFGEETYLDGTLNRKYLSAAVFNNPEKLAALNSIVHPATIRHAAEWMKQQNATYLIKEAALIFESGSNKDLDFVIGVYAPLELRILRTMSRDEISREQVLARIKNQMDEDEKMALCDFIIQNDEEHSLLEKALLLHKRFIELSNKVV